GSSAGQRSETRGSLPSRDVCILNRLLRADNTAENVFRAGISQRISSPLFLENRRRVVHRDDAERISLVQYQRAELRLAVAYRILQHRVEYRLQLAGGTADDPRHLGGGGLLLHGLVRIIGALAQFVEQAGVRDGDDGLAGEVRHQIDLLIGEGPHFLAVDGNRADELVLLEHRDGEKSPATSEFGDGNEWA